MNRQEDLPPIGERLPQFHFDESSVIDIQTLRERGWRFKEIRVGDHIILLPDADQFDKRHLNPRHGGGIRKMISIGFNWRDLWVGVYVTKDRKTFFICPLPCIVIGIGPGAKTRLHGT